MARITRLTENDLARIVRRVITEQGGAVRAAGKALGKALPNANQPLPVNQPSPVKGTPTAATAMNYNSLRPCNLGEVGKLVKQSNILALSNNKPFCKIVSPAR
jgi:hypothetical protein